VYAILPTGASAVQTRWAGAAPSWIRCGQDASLSPRRVRPCSFTAASRSRMAAYRTNSTA